MLTRKCTHILPTSSGGGLSTYWQQNVNLLHRSVNIATLNTLPLNHDLAASHCNMLPNPKQAPLTHSGHHLAEPVREAVHNRAGMLCGWCCRLMEGGGCHLPCIFRLMPTPRAAWQCLLTACCSWWRLLTGWCCTSAGPRAPAANCLTPCWLAARSGWLRGGAHRRG
jgi:hypothetical protein